MSTCCGIGLWANLGSISPPAGCNLIQTDGFTVVGVGAARYSPDPNQITSTAESWRKQDATGLWWLLAEPLPTFEMFGALGDGVAPDLAPLRDGIRRVAILGGGRVTASPGANYLTSGEVQAEAGVFVDLNGATIEAHLTNADDAAVSVLSNSAWVRGTIIVRSEGQPGSQGACHAPVRAGPLYDPTRTIIDPQDGISGWLLEDLVVESDAVSEFGVGKVGVQISGGAHDWVVRRVHAPDSDRMTGLIHADWGGVGPIRSDPTLMSANRTAFENGTGWTTHPHNGLIADCHGGQFTAAVTGTDTGAHGFRLSGCHDITIRDCSMGSITYAGLRIVAGDLGFEFAKGQSRIRPHLGLHADGVTIQDAKGGYGCWVDFLADNVARAADLYGYDPLLPLICRTDLVVERFHGASLSEPEIKISGVRCDSTLGGVFADLTVTDFKDGIQVDESCQEVTFVRPLVADSDRHGMIVSHPTKVPSAIRVEEPVFLRNGKEQDGAHLFFEASAYCSVTGGQYGDPKGSDTAVWGIRVGQDSVGASVLGRPLFHSTKPITGIALTISSGNAYGAITVVEGAEYKAGVANPYAGVPIVPTSLRVSPSGRRNRTWQSSRGSLSADTTPPSGFPGLQGDYIEFSDPSAGTGALRGSVCVTSGNPGIWQQM